MSKLTDVAQRFVAKHGSDRAAEITGKKKEWIDRLSSGVQPSVGDLDKMLEFDPQLLDDVHVPPGSVVSEPVNAPAQYEWPSGHTLYILMPTNRAPHWALLKAFGSIYESSKMRFWVQPTNYLPRGRNQLAHRFLESGLPWSLWWDDDIVPPHGDVGFFQAWTQFMGMPVEYINLNPIGQLLSRKEKFIGGCYFRHNVDGKPQFAEGYSRPEVNAACHAGPRNITQEVGWIGMGFTLVHRDVFLDVIKNGGTELLLPEHQGAQGYKYRFFSPIKDECEYDASEDVSFCARAKRAGHKIFVDHAVMPVHVGAQGFGYWNTRGVNPNLH